MKPRHLTVILSICVVTLQIATAFGQPFPCNGTFYIVQNVNPPTYTLSEINITGKNVTFKELASFPFELNGIGFHRPSGSIISIVGGTNEFVQIGSNGSYEVIGSDPEFVQWRSSSADCTKDGLFVMHDRLSNSLRFYALENEVIFSHTVPLYWDPATGNTGTVDVKLNDIAIDPLDPGTLYSYQRNYDPHPDEPIATRGHLLGIDIDSTSEDYGMTRSIGEIDGDVTRHIGAMFFDAEGVLYAFGSVEAPDQEQKFLIAIDKSNAGAQIIGEGPVSVGVDGCSCPYGLELNLGFQNSSVSCEEQHIQMQLEIVNGTDRELTDLIVSDTLDPGLEFVNVFVSDAPGGLLHMGLERRAFFIENITVEPNSSLTIRILLAVPNAEGIYRTQARLFNIPPEFGDEILSDDPNSARPRDSTVFNTEYLAKDYIGHDSLQLCPGDTIAFYNQLYTTTGSDSVMLIAGAVDGCDSIIVVEIQESTRPITQEDISLCFGEVYTDGSNSFSESGIYQFSRNSAVGGCDTMVDLNLHIADEFIPEYAPEYSAPAGSTIQLQVAANRAISRIEWHDTTGLSCTNCPAPSVTVAGSGGFSFTIWDENGCEAQGVIQLRAEAAKEELFIPNIFSPNQDGFNDVFFVSGPSVQQVLSMAIYDRFGSLVYQRLEFTPGSESDGWDGSFNGTDLDPGVFVYHINYRNQAGDEVSVSGDVTLLK